MNEVQLPFANNKVPICNSVDELNKFLSTYPNYKFCLYLAFKDNEGWEKSTSRVYMNQLFPNFIYLPVNIRKDDLDSLKEIYKLAEQNEQIVAINQTQPHKSNQVLKEYFHNLPNLPTNIDTLVKGENNKLLPYDLNGVSFVEWFKEEVDNFTEKVVILVGIGGAGEPIARRIILDKPNKLFLVNPSSREQLKEELSKLGAVEYYPDINSIKVEENINNLVVINAAEKEGASDETGIYDLLEIYKNKHNTFVDLRPQLDIEVVEKSKELGWKGYTGYGMNARNDYTLVTMIAELINQEPPTFIDFKKLVADSS